MSPIAVRRIEPVRTYELPPPGTFGDMFPERFTGWRDGQAKAVLTTLDGERRFIAQAAPTGFGKSLAYLGAALLGGLRVVILTSTKGLQEQLLRDFNGDGKTRIVDIRGQNAYRCVAAGEFGYSPLTTCDFAPCHAGRRCRLRDGGCEYYDANRAANAAQVVVTNYSYWLSINKYGQGLGKFDLLVLDEAHDAPDMLAEFMSVEIDPDELPPGMKILDPGADIIQWREWATFNLSRIAQMVEQLQMQVRNSDEVPQNVIRHMASLKRLQTKLATLASAGDDWVTEKVEQWSPSRSSRPKAWSMRFDPVWPYTHAESLLFLGTPKVMLVSATLRHKTAFLLGIDTNDLDFYEYPSSFPVARRPIIHVPTVQMNHRTPPGELSIWLQRIDQIIKGRQDRKGIIQTVSFARAKQIMEHSDYAHMMLLNDSKNTKRVVEQFKLAPRPCILVSPSVTTGYDFPYTECEYQIICKLPFPDNRAKVVKARSEQDKEYSNYMTMQVLIQEAGRGMRAEDDQCETLIVDDSILWFMKYNKKFAPKWFQDALVWASGVPVPLAKLPTGFGARR